MDSDSIGQVSTMVPWAVSRFTGFQPEQPGIEQPHQRRMVLHSHATDRVRTNSRSVTLRSAEVRLRHVEEMEMSPTYL